MALWAVLCVALLLTAFLFRSFDHNLATTRTWALVTPVLTFFGGVLLALNFRMPAAKRRYYHDHPEEAPGARMVQSWRAYKAEQSHPWMTVASELVRLPFRAFQDARRARRDPSNTSSTVNPENQTEDADERGSN